MAPAIVHFLVGASLALILAAPFAYYYDLGWRWPLWLVAIGGVWGLIPDVHHIAPVYEAEFRVFHESPWVDLFAFHYTLDRPYVRARYTESVFGSILCFFIAVSVYTVAGSAGDRSTHEVSSGPPLEMPAVLLALGSLFIGIGLGVFAYATVG